MSNETKTTMPAEVQNAIKPVTYFLGLQEKKGSFTDDNGKLVNYHNMEVSVADIPITSSNTVNVYGLEAVVLKVKADNAAAVFGFNDWYSGFNPAQWINKPIDIRFDRKGNLSSIRLVK